MPPVNVVPVAPPVNMKIGKFKASKTIVKESWAVLKQDKEIVWFPIISSLITLAVFIVIGAIYFFLILSGDISSLEGENTESGNNLIAYAMMFAYYLVTFFIVNFFQAGLLIVVQGRFSGQDLSFNDGMRGATDNIRKIFLWSVVGATVGVVLQVISDKLKFTGKIIAWFFGAAWGILTYFSLPALIIGNLGIKDSFKESASIIRKTWGETIIINFGVGLFFTMLTLLLLAIFIGINVILSSLPVLIITGVMFFLLLIVLSIISSTLNVIFKLVLFNYALNGQIPAGFSQNIVQGAVTGK